MSVQSTYEILNQLPSSIFFKMPATIQINEEGVTPYATSYKIEVLIKELKERGPFIALGKIGPSCYQVDPFRLKDKFCGKDIYGWKPGTARIEASKESSLLVLGAKKGDDGEYVFFTLSQDVTIDSTSHIREYKSSNVDKKIYVVSHKTFSNYLFDIYPCTAFSSTPAREYVKSICSLPLDSILDNGEGESECKAIGQAAFDEYKGKAGGNSSAGKKAVQKICDLIKSAALDGSLRKQYVERAWNGIGDSTWRWKV